MRHPRTNSESVKVVYEYLRAEIERAEKELSSDQWQAILVGAGDEGEIVAYPCRLILPFHYPASVDELDDCGSDHFSFPEDSWNLRWQPIREFVEQYELFAAIEDNDESVHTGNRHLQRRITVFRDACSSLDPALTIFGIESDSGTWMEVNTFHISGPRIPLPPPPVSDAQVLARLCCHTHSYLGKSRFRIEGGAIIEVDFDGADTTDATIDLLRGIPNLRELLRGLRKVSLESTLVSDRSLRFLERELPHVEVAHSPHLKG